MPVCSRVQGRPAEKAVRVRSGHAQERKRLYNEETRLHNEETRLVVEQKYVKI
jgi:hypothetical protein